MALRPDGTDQDEFDSYGRRRKRRQKRGTHPLVVILAVLTLCFFCLVGLGTGAYFFVTLGFLADKPRDKLLGTWEYYRSQKPLIMLSFEFRKDGGLTLRAVNEKNNASEQREGKYEVTGETRDKVTVSVRWQDGQETAWEIEFLPDDEMRMHFLKSKAEPVTYKRKR